MSLLDRLRSYERQKNKNNFPQQIWIISKKTCLLKKDVKCENRCPMFAEKKVNFPVCVFFSRFLAFLLMTLILGFQEYGQSGKTLVETLKCVTVWGAFHADLRFGPNKYVSDWLMHAPMPSCSLTAARSVKWLLISSAGTENLFWPSADFPS